MYVPLVLAAMTRANRLLSGLNRLAITEPGIGGSQRESEQPLRTIAVATMNIRNRDVKGILIITVPYESNVFMIYFPLK